jgi:predicted RecA/RadA family phage recombinase
MALEVKYEGLIDGTMNVMASELGNPAKNIVAGRICVLSGADAGTVQCDDIVVGGEDVPYGLLADGKEDIVASGKVTVYLDGVFYTDQVDATSIVKGSLLSFDADGILVIAASGDYIVGTALEEVADNGMLLFKLNITGAVAA